MRNGATPADVDAYLAAVPEGQRAALEHLRRVILAAAPGAVEVISYGIPTFKVKGKTVAHLGAAAKHCAFYPGAATQAFETELAGWPTAKGTVRFQPDAPLPDALVTAIVKHNLARQGVA